MNEWQCDVLDFHTKLGQKIGDPRHPEIGDAELRAKLIAEEASETIAALGFDVDFALWRPGGDTVPMARFEREHKANLAEAIDGLADLIYVVLGSAVSMGIDLEPFWQEVQRSNLAKVGGAKRGDGKALKPAGWTPPDIAGLLAASAGADTFALMVRASAMCYPETPQPCIDCGQIESHDEWCPAMFTDPRRVTLAHLTDGEARDVAA